MKLALTLLCVLFSSAALADGKYCPDTGTYDIVLIGDELWITHLNHPAYCVLAEGITYNCTEKYADGQISKYTVKAVEFDPGLAFYVEGEDAPWGVPPCP